MADMAMARNTEYSYLRQLTEEPLIIDAVDGNETLAGVTVLHYSDGSFFENHPLGEPGPATGKTPVIVYEMIEDGNFLELFGHLHSDVRELCLTEAQIMNYTKKHAIWLRTDGSGTFFLYQSKKGDLRVAFVRVRSNSIHYFIARYSNPLPWHASYSHRVVVPQLP